MARLLEAMIDAAPHLTLLEIEGDAVFLYAWTAEDREGAARLGHVAVQRVDDRLRSRGRTLAQELEGLDTVPTYFMDLAEIAGDALPYLLGLKRRRFAARGLTAA